MARNVIGRLHLEQIRTGGLSFAVQIIAKMLREEGTLGGCRGWFIPGGLRGSIGIWRVLATEALLRIAAKVDHDRSGAG